MSYLHIASLIEILSKEKTQGGNRMKTITAIAIVAAALAMIPATVNAAPKTATHKAKVTKVAAATKYECVKCHMQYSAADAKKAKYKCEMDGGKLVAVKPAGKTTSTHHM
jgi:hypothetical protein